MEEEFTIKNVFLTGEINVGKSYIINKFLDYTGASHSGFKTLPKYNGDHLKGYIIYDELSDCASCCDDFVGLNIEINDGKKCLGISETFDTKGVEILENALDSESKYILMDELGFFENESHIFQKKVHQILDSERNVIGVIKKKDNSFLDSIRKRDDVEIIEITLENRNEMFKLFTEKWRKLNEDVT